jgi:hypothetical protein
LGVWGSEVGGIGARDSGFGARVVVVCGFAILRFAVSVRLVRSRSSAFWFADAPKVPLRARDRVRTTSARVRDDRGRGGPDLRSWGETADTRTRELLRCVLRPVPQPATPIVQFATCNLHPKNSPPEPQPPQQHQYPERQIPNFNPPHCNLPTRAQNPESRAPICNNTHLLPHMLESRYTSQP